MWCFTMQKSKLKMYECIYIFYSDYFFYIYKLDVLSVNENVLTYEN
jgi:hypothetical protein